jgi:hypothetical protein
MVGGEVDVGVGEDDGVVLGAAERLHPLAVGGSALVDVLRDRRRADEGDGGDVGVLEDRVHGLLVAVDDVEHALGQTGLGPQLGDEHRRRRVALAGLEHERVAARDGDRVHPHRHHHREVERRDAGDDAERLAEREDVDPGGRLVGVLPLDQVGDAAGELHDLEATLHLAEGVGDDLAVLVGDDLREVLGPGVDQLAEGEEGLGPLAQRSLAPRLERLGGAGHGRVDVALGGEDDLGLLLPPRRVVDRRVAGGGTGGGASVDPVLDGAHGLRFLRFLRRVVAGLAGQRKRRWSALCAS